MELQSQCVSVEGLVATLPLPPVQVQRGQGQEEVLGGPEGHLVLRRARNDGLTNVMVGSQITRKENVSKNAFGIYFCWLPCLTKGSMQQREWLFVSTLHYMYRVNHTVRYKHSIQGQCNIHTGPESSVCI